MMGMSSMTGAVLVAFLAFAKINEKPRGMLCTFSSFSRAANHVGLGHASLIQKRNCPLDCSTKACVKSVSQ